MLHYFKITLFFLCSYLLSSVLYASPWFTGPILAPAGRDVDRGHTNFEIYGLDVNADGRYDNSGKISNTPLFRSFILNPLLAHGFTDWLDIQISLPYSFNATQNKNYHRLADISLAAGFQIAEQKNSKWLPDTRFFIQETFPTGKYNHLNPAFLGTDVTGLGSYRTQLALNFQHLKEIYDSHYLRTRLIFSRIFSSKVDVTGLNSFGGTINTQGTVSPGIQDTVDLAFEYTLTQNWVAVMEGYIIEGQSTRFNGILDIVNDSPTSFQNNRFYEYGLVPAVEYNFSETLGIIGGVWFPVIGRNSSHFTTYVIALNAYW